MLTTEGFSFKSTSDREGFSKENFLVGSISQCDKVMYKCLTFLRDLQFMTSYLIIVSRVKMKNTDDACFRKFVTITCLQFVYCLILIYWYSLLLYRYMLVIPRWRKTRHSILWCSHFWKRRTTSWRLYHFWNKQNWNKCRHTIDWYTHQEVK